MRKRYVCRKDKEGNPIMVPADSIAVHKPGETLEDFTTRMRKTLYQLECSEGSRFAVPGFSNSKLKRVWMDEAA